MNCIFCGRDCVTKSSWVLHSRRCSKNPDKATLSQKWLDAQKNRKASNGAIKAKEEGREFIVSSETRDKLRLAATGHTHTKETKEKLSKLQRDWLAAHPDSHPWKCPDKFSSIPCEVLKDRLLQEGIHFVPEWQPLSDRGFSIDIAFPDLKLGIEVNGHQHYSTGTLRPYYQDRHDLIESQGWVLIEFLASDVYKEGTVASLISLLKEKKPTAEYSSFIEEQKNLKAIKEKEQLFQKLKGRIQRETENARRISVILSADVDYSKVGWVSEISRITGIATARVKKFMKKNMPSFCEIHCI